MGCAAHAVQDARGQGAVGRRAYECRPGGWGRAGRGERTRRLPGGDRFYTFGFCADVRQDRAEGGREVVFLYVDGSVPVLGRAFWTADVQRDRGGCADRLSGFRVGRVYAFSDGEQAQRRGGARVLRPDGGRGADVRLSVVDWAGAGGVRHYAGQRSAVRVAHPGGRSKPGRTAGVRDGGELDRSLRVG